MIESVIKQRLFRETLPNFSLMLATSRNKTGSVNGNRDYLLGYKKAQGFL